MPSPRWPHPDVLLPSWQIHLRAENKTAGTVRTYTKNLGAFTAWAAANGRHPSLDRHTVKEFLGDVLERGEATTARAYLVALKSFSRWAFEEEEIPANECAGISPPKLSEKVLPPFSEDELKALLKACDGKRFLDRRDEALMRFLLDTGARADEAVHLTVGELNIGKGEAKLHGKGDRERMVAFGDRTARSLDRYMRVRRHHPLAGGERVWLSARLNASEGFEYSALWKALGKRAAAAGVGGFHPHRLRRTMSDRWLAAGGSSDGLMAVAGWTDPAMVRRYTAARASERALSESRRLGIGDV
jgi:site-specific recombinase XerD